MSQHDPNTMSPSLEALHSARSALTVASGRLALVQRHIERGEELDRITNDLAVIPPHLAQLSAAIDRLARVAIACERADRDAAPDSSSESDM